MMVIVWELLWTEIPFDGGEDCATFPMSESARNDEGVGRPASHEQFATARDVTTRVLGIVG